MPFGSAMLQQRRALLLSGCPLLSVLLAVGQAQVPPIITPDGTLGTAVIQRGTIYDITGGTRPGNCATPVSLSWNHRGKVNNFFVDMVLSSAYNRAHRPLGLSSYFRRCPWTYPYSMCSLTSLWHPAP